LGEPLGLRWWMTIRLCGSTLLLAALSGVFGLQASSGLDKQTEDRELAAFRLSMEKLRQAAQVDKLLDKLSQTDPSLKNATQFVKQGGVLSIDETVNRIDEHPQARATIENAGFSTRKYVLTKYCFERSTQALFVQDDPRERSHPPGASKENVAFVKKHLKEINRLFSENP